MERTNITKSNILIAGDFNAAGYDWGDKSFYLNCHFCDSVRIRSVKTFLDYMNLDQLNNSIVGTSALDLVKIDFVKSWTARGHSRPCEGLIEVIAVSYTHLDVYKRQVNNH